MNTAVNNPAKPNRSRTRLALAASILLTSTPLAAWAGIRCEQTGASPPVVEGSLVGTWDPEQYENGQLIREVRLKTASLSQITCRKNGSSADNFAAMLQVTFPSATASWTRTGAFWTSNTYPGFGFEFLARSAGGELLSVDPNTATIWGERLPITDGNFAGVPFNGQPVGVAAVLRVYKLTEEARDLNMGKADKSLMEVREFAGHSNDQTNCATDPWSLCVNNRVETPRGGRLQLTAVKKPTCSIPLPHVRVDGLRIVPSKVQGPVLAEKQFSLMINCQGGESGQAVVPDFNMYDKYDVASQADHLVLAPGSTATGLAVEILRSNGEKVIFDQQRRHPWNEGSVSNGNHSVNFTARVVEKPGEPLGMGSFTAEAVYSFSYY